MRSARIAALICSTTVLGGCAATGAGSSPQAAQPHLSHAESGRLLALVSTVRSDARARRSNAASGSLTRFISDIRSLRASGHLSARTASRLTAQARAIAPEIPRAPAAVTTATTTTATTPPATTPTPPPATTATRPPTTPPPPHATPVSPPAVSTTPPGQGAWTQYQQDPQHHHGPGWWRHHGWPGTDQQTGDGNS
jgi:hypothetical protein